MGKTATPAEAVDNTPLGIFHRLFQPFPDDVLKERRQGGEVLTYAEWYVYVARAHKELAPLGFSVEIRGVHAAGDYLYLIVRVVDHNTGRNFDGLGQAPIGKSKIKGYGGAGPEAFSQALRRAMALMGMGLDLYMAEGDVEFVEGSSEEEDEEPESDPEGEEDPEDAEEGEDPEEEEGDDEPSEVQMGRLAQLGKLFEENDLDLDKYRRKMRRGLTKSTAGLIIRQMKEVLEAEDVDVEAELKKAGK